MNYSKHFFEFFCFVDLRYPRLCNSLNSDSAFVVVMSTMFLGVWWNIFWFWWKFFKYYNQDLREWDKLRIFNLPAPKKGKPASQHYIFPFFSTDSLTFSMINYEIVTKFIFFLLFFGGDAMKTKKTMRSLKWETKNQKEIM